MKIVIGPCAGSKWATRSRVRSSGSSSGAPGARDMAAGFSQTGGWRAAALPENPLPCLLADRHHGGVLEPALDRDRVIALADLVHAADRLDAILLLDLLGDHRRRGEYRHAALAEHLQQRAVVELGDDSRPDSLGIEPLVER